MEREWIGRFLIGFGLELLTESLIILSPAFETILWETLCTFAKVAPVVRLYATAVIGLILAGIDMLYERRKREDEIGLS